MFKLILLPDLSLFDLTHLNVAANKLLALHKIQSQYPNTSRHTRRSRGERGASRRWGTVAGAVGRGMTRPLSPTDTR